MTPPYLAPLTFSTIETFPLYWRWSQPSHALFPLSVLATIRPLTSDAATSLYPEALRRYPGCARVVSLINISAGDDAPEAAVRVSLQQLPVGTPHDIIVHWGRTTAVLTTWETFVTYWDDFCYPGSDDVAVWDPDADWALCYCHEEHFGFWRLRAHPER